MRVGQGASSQSELATQMFPGVHGVADGLVIRVLPESPGSVAITVPYGDTTDTALDRLSVTQTLPAGR